MGFLGKICVFLGKNIRFREDNGFEIFEITKNSRKKLKVLKNFQKKIGKIQKLF